jgi:hypothetical protein
MARKHEVALEVEETVAALASQVLLMAPSVKFFQFWPLGALHTGRCAQAATIPPVIIALGAARAAPQAKKVQEHADISEIEGEISLDSTARTSR